MLPALLHCPGTSRGVFLAGLLRLSFPTPPPPRSEEELHELYAAEHGSDRGRRDTQREEHKSHDGMVYSVVAVTGVRGD